MTPLAYRPKSDVLFKMLFTRNEHLLRSFVSAALGIPAGDIKDLVIKNPEILPDKASGKFCRLDLHLTMDGYELDVEIQLKDEGNFKDRALFYWARLYAGALDVGNDYAGSVKTVLISIIDFRLFDSPAYHSEFVVTEKSRGELLTDKLAIHFFELPKLPEKPDPSNRVEVWLAFFDAETEEDLGKIEELGGEDMEQAVQQARKLAGTTEYRELERMLDKAARDESNALRTAEKRGIAIGEARGITIGEKRGEARGISIGEKLGIEKMMKLMQKGYTPDQIREMLGKE